MGLFVLGVPCDSPISPSVFPLARRADGGNGGSLAVKVLVLHALRSDSRLTTIEHALCFGRHLDGCEVTYLNAFGRIPTGFERTRFDVVVLTYEMVAQRAMPFWDALVYRLKPIIAAARTRVVMPQDDYSHAAFLDELVVNNDVQLVFSPVTRDLDMLYPHSIARGVQFHEAFTGYWESGTRLPLDTFRRPFKERSIDLGQRVRFLPPNFGPKAQRKGQIAIEFSDLAQKAGFRCDVSTRDSDVLVGDAWWRFLGDMRFTVGRLSGASIADPVGKLQAKVTQLELRKPAITHKEIAERLKIDRIEQGDFSAVSPRLFECAAMGVCQVLEEAHYVDGFEPWRDYIPLAPDLSNTAEVLEAMRDWDRCEEIAASAENVLIRSGRHSYRQFVKRFMDVCTGHDIDAGGKPVVIDVDEALFPDPDPAAVERVRALARRLVIRDRRTAADAASETAREWADCFRRKELIVESLTIPWCPAKPLLGTS